MDDQAKYEALKGEHEVEPAQLLRKGEEAKVVYLRVFKDEGGLIRLVIDEEPGGPSLQLVTGRKELIARLEDPQDAG